MLFRSVVLALLAIVIVKSLLGWTGGKTFGKSDDKLSLWLLILTHIQLIVGFALYFVSDAVKFNGETMKNATLRYWSVEHVTMMLIAIVRITIARITHKKQTTDTGKFKRLFILNALALLIIVVTIMMSGRGVIVPTGM